MPVTALLLVLRFVITFGLGWLAKHGMDTSFTDPQFSDAVVQIIGAVIGGLGMLLWGLYEHSIRVCCSG